MKNLISRLSDLWQSLPSEVKGSIVTISVLVGLIILTALILGLENMWTSFVATISRQAIFRGMLLILVTLGLSVIWVLVYGRFVISSAYNEAVNEVKKALNEDIHKLNTLASIHIPESTNQMREYHEETKKNL